MNLRIYPNHVLVLASLLPLFALAAGCGGGASGSTVPTTTPSTPTPLPTSTAVPPVLTGELLFVSAAKVYSVSPNGSRLTTIPTSGEGQLISLSVAWLPRREELFYAEAQGSRGGVTSNIRRVDRDGTNDRQIATTFAFHPAVSSDGSRIAYDDNTNVFVANADGTNAKKVALGLYPSWSPDGQRLVYSRSTNSQADLYSASVSGSGEKRLTNTPALDETAPQFSPDGTRLVYTSANSNGGQSEIYRMNADGSSPTRLTNTVTSSSLTGNSNPRWTLDGGHIAFLSARNDNGFQIFVMDADGSNQTPLYTAPSSVSSFDLR